MQSSTSLNPNEVRIYTDGSAHYKTGVGAWAFVAVYPDGKEEKKCKSYQVVTNNKMELCAVLEALDYIIKLEKPEEQGKRYSFQIISDSEYVVNGVTDWRHKWKLKNWKDVKNLPLWLAVDTALAALADMGLEVKFSWVRGHAGDKYNEVVDKLAHGEYKKLTDALNKRT